MTMINRFTVCKFMWSFKVSISLSKKSQVKQSYDRITPGRAAYVSLSWFNLSVHWMKFFNIFMLFILFGEYFQMAEHMVIWKQGDRNYQIIEIQLWWRCNAQLIIVLDKFGVVFEKYLAVFGCNLQYVEN